MNEGSADRISRLKTTIVAFVSFGVGVTLLTVSRTIDSDPAWSWLSFWPLNELGGILVGAGLLGIAWDYFDGKDRERRDDARVRWLLKEAAPDFRDAVVRGFGVENDDLKRVATYARAPPRRPTVRLRGLRRHPRPGCPCSRALA